MRTRKTRCVLRILLAVLLVIGCLLTGCDDGETLEDLLESGSISQVKRGTGTLDLVRTKPAGTRPKGIEKDTWTIFVYLCGSDLESDGGSATTDLAEMVGAQGSDRVSFVVQTGGAKKWQGDVKSNKMQRYFIQDGAITRVDSSKHKDMGDPTTLSSFIEWGLKEYPADHMGLILWDHGGGSVAGVCFDERSDYDSLTLPELRDAFASVNNTLWQKFDFVGFDACLMSSLECANTLASYANYMIASAETEPAEGWEYSSIMEYLADNPSADGKSLGKVLCDGYLESLDERSAKWATLALVDLSRIDNLMQSFYHFSQEMYDAGSDQSVLAAMTRSIKQVDNYGSNNWLEGYTNMVDLAGIVDSCAGVAPSVEEVKAALKDAVTYQVCGKYHAKSGGLSLYYPLDVPDSEDLAGFAKVAANPSYLSFVDRLACGATYDAGEQYTNYDEEEQLSQMEEQGSSYWNYVNEHTSESHVISFEVEPQLDDEGAYWFRLDAESIDNAATVNGLVYALSEDGADWYTLGETCDIFGDWDSGEFVDGFDGKWLSLPDGQNLCLYIETIDDESVLYTSPILLNGKERYLRLRQNLESGKVTVEGTWDGIGENGALGRGTVPLSKGDVIAPCYDAFEVEDNSKESTYIGEEYTVGKNGLKVKYDYLPAATYQYSFLIEDVFGDALATSPAEFEIDESGDIYFLE